MNKDKHVILLPRKVIVGSNLIPDIPHYIKSIIAVKPPYNRFAIAIITGPNVLKLFGKKVIEVLEDSNFNVTHFIVKTPSRDEIEDLYKKVHESKPDIVLGLGGGKSIDAAKYVAAKLNKPLISMPTAASHDGISSPFSSFKGAERPTSFYTKEPDIILADTSIIVKAPPRLNKAGAGDAIAKLSAVLDWRLAHRLKGEYYGGYAASLALMSARHVIKYSHEIAKSDEPGIRILVEALISSGVAMCIAGSTRPASGSEHLFSHALDILVPRPALHGEQVGVGTIMMLYLHGKSYWRKVRTILKKIGLPVTARELGIDDYIIVKALTIAHKIRPERYTILGSDGLTWEAAERLARETGVID